MIIAVLAKKHTLFGLVYTRESNSNAKNLLALCKRQKDTRKKINIKNARENTNRE